MAGYVHIGAFGVRTQNVAEYVNIRDSWCCLYMKLVRRQVDLSSHVYCSLCLQFYNINFGVILNQICFIINEFHGLLIIILMLHEVGIQCACAVNKRKQNTTKSEVANGFPLPVTVISDRS